MTDWKKVNGSQDSAPTEFDLTTSKSVVYQRRNIEIVTTEDGDLWEYEEREISRDEYEALCAELLPKYRADIDFLAAMMDVEL